MISVFIDEETEKKLADINHFPALSKTVAHLTEEDGYHALCTGALAYGKFDRTKNPVCVRCLILVGMWKKGKKK